MEGCLSEVLYRESGQDRINFPTCGQDRLHSFFVGVYVLRILLGWLGKHGKHLDILVVTREHPKRKTRYKNTTEWGSKGKTNVKGKTNKNNKYNKMGPRGTAPPPKTKTRCGSTKGCPTKQAKEKHLPGEQTQTNKSISTWGSKGKVKRDNPKRGHNSRRKKQKNKKTKQIKSSNKLGSKGKTHKQKTQTPSACDPWPPLAGWHLEKDAKPRSLRCACP